MALHPIFEKYQPFRGPVPAGYSYDWLGVIIEDRLFDPEKEILEHEPRVVETGAPASGCAVEASFDLIALCKSVDRADRTFTMFELGAGYGYWLTEGAAAARQRNLVTRLVGVEAEPTHFQMMLRHLRNNGIDPQQHLIIEAAVAAEDGEVSFLIGNPLEWWGQAVVPAGASSYGTTEVRPVKAISLRALLDGHNQVNVIHMDVQGVEYDVLRSCIELVNERVETLIIGTHTKQIESDLRDMLGSHCWNPIYDFTTGEINETPYGPVEFVDGVQIWENLRLI